MPEVSSSHPRSRRSLAAIAMFIVVYLGVLVLVFAPRDMIASQPGVAFYGAQD